MFRNVTSIPNVQGSGIIKEFFFEDTGPGWESAICFAKQEDRPGYGVYYCVGTLKERRRIKENVIALASIHSDLDLRSIEESGEEVLRVLNELMLPPTEIRDSGRGLHAVWKLKEPVVDEEGLAQVEAIQRGLVRLLAADPIPVHRAALFRLPGTHNSKGGIHRQCCVLKGIEAEYGPSEFDAMFDLYGGQPLLNPKRVEIGGDNGTAKSRDAGDMQASSRVDADERLAAMRYQGGGESSIHLTQLQVTASLTSAGRPVEETVTQVLAATKEAVKRNPACTGWNWEAEETGIARMCYDLINKAMREDGEDLGHCLPGALYDDWGKAIAEGKRPNVCMRYGDFHVRGYPRNGADTAQTVVEGNVLRLVSSQEAPLSEPNEAPKPQYRFRLIPFNEMRPGAEPLYLVDELVPAAGLVDVWGKPKCFKSFWTLDLMFHVATGREYRDRCVQQGAVVYCAFEGAHGYKKRMEAIRRHYDIEEDEEVPLYVMPGQASLVRDHGRIIQDVKAQIGDTNVAAFVLDTLNRSLDGSESKDVDMTAYVRAAEAIRDAFKCVVIIVHHCGLDETRPRGHTSLPAAVDAQLAVTREASSITVTVEMMRDGPEEASIASVVESVEVGMDAAGAPLTSLVVKPTDARASSFPQRRWTRSLTLFRRVLCTALNDSDEELTVSGHMVRVADRETVRSLFYAQCVADGGTEEAQDTRKKRFLRAVEKAQELSLIGVKVEPTGRTLLWLASADEEAAIKGHA